MCRRDSPRSFTPGPTPGRLGGDHHVVPPGSKRAAEDPLGRLSFGRGRNAWSVEDRRVAVHVGGVEEVDAEVKCRVDHPVGVPLARRDSERGRAHADPGHLDTSRPKQGIFHQSVRLRSSSPSRSLALSSSARHRLRRIASAASGTAACASHCAPGLTGRIDRASDANWQQPTDADEDVGERGVARRRARNGSNHRQTTSGRPRHANLREPSATPVDSGGRLTEPLRLGRECGTERDL